MTTTTSGNSAPTNLSDDELAPAWNSVRPTSAQLQWLDQQIAHVMRDIYPLDVFGNLAHVMGIYHGLHILRREARQLSARDDIEYLPEETHKFYAEATDPASEPQTPAGASSKKGKHHE